MQVILGAGGDIGIPLAKELKKYTDKIRLVARNPQKVNTDDELFVADITNGDLVKNAVTGADVVYLVVGFPYDINIWRKNWPLVIDNVINACITHKAKLVFLDNVYVYDYSEIPHMQENSTMNPSSEKGKVRMIVLEKLMAAMQTKGLPLIIARSADFYGPNARNGIINTLLLTPIKKGKMMMWQSNANKIHSFTYTPDAAKATAILGNTADAYNQVWHLPTAFEKLRGKDFIKIAADLANKKPSFFLLKPWLMKIIGLFDKTIRNLVEMQYQNTQDYFFDSTKFCEKFNFTPTTYKDGMKETFESIQA
ncbi:Putative NADH-flavin reductase [Chryseobacterium nakagawai]|uniref:NAD-dependent epimerase/dehydratase family protein n=1 Tax=Chryseobacterium nakagawai TaxID=1241982 RepID=A0AAD0YFH1_CHRNA|nr:NAD-dependent epimerase/dehydratase family protein [Chryseobacterium nakagawai]AZA90056.1 NAD-dependent epimerase/dehydratase family protein [Chryseobacterium nakagawai]VEH21499.1 Putative NADH-flavin reductase [Chryseobacterium nakagawai]